MSLERTDATGGSVDRGLAAGVARVTALLGEGDEQNRVSHRDADGHDRADERLDVDRLAGRVEGDDDSRDDGRSG